MENHIQKEITSSRGRPKMILSDKPDKPRKQQALNNVVEYKIPTTVEEAMGNPNNNALYGTLPSEMKLHNRNGTWSLADLPEGAIAINSRRVYAIKRNERGEVDRFKAKLVAKVVAKDLE